MKHTTLPLRRYNTTDYPNLDPEAEGAIIPIAYGTIEGIMPTEIDTTAGTFKATDHALEEFTEVRSAWRSPLIEDLDYETDLANGEFTLLVNAYITVPGTYYFAIECDYSMSGSNYFGISRAYNVYGDGQSYEIDTGDTWTGTADGNDLIFTVWGRTSPTSGEVAVVTNDVTPDASELGVNESYARTKIGQSFYLGTSPTYYISKITVKGTIHGTLTGKNLRARLYSDTAGTAVGGPSEWIPVAATTDLPFLEVNENTEITCDIKAPGTEYDQVADILPHTIETIMGKSAGLLDATELANLATDRTEALRIWLGNETIEFGDFVAKLEAGQLWKLVPLGDGTYGTIVAETGEPGNLLTLRDHDYLSFKMEVDQSEVHKNIDVFYAQDPVIDDYLATRASSDVASFFYLNESTHEVETYILGQADAEALAAAYLARFEVPVIKATFEVHAKGLELLPYRDKVKLTRARAPYPLHPGWSGCDLIRLPIPDANLEGFPLRVPLVANTRIGQKARLDGYDIRFFALDGVTELPYERESFSITDGEATGEFWVKVNAAVSGTYIYIYYGNASAADGENPEAAWDDDFKAVYHMKDATTSTIADSTANNNHGTKKGANEPIEAAGKIGKGQDFDGTDDSITVAHAANLNVSNITVGAWLKKDGSLSGHRRLVTKNSVAGYMLNAYEGNLEVYVAGTGIGGGGVLATDVWAHICFTFDGIRIKIYRDGVETADSAWGGVIDDGTAPLSIGHEGGVNVFDGLFDEVRISSIARSADWIAYEYANMNPADGGLTWIDAEPAAGLAGVLMRIVRLVKKPATNTVEIVAAIWGNSAT